MELVAGLMILLVLGVSLGLGLALVYFVRREGPKESGLDWDSAERAARKDDGGPHARGEHARRDEDHREDRRT